MHRDIIYTICVIKDALNISSNYSYEWLREIKTNILSNNFEMVTGHFTANQK